MTGHQKKSPAAVDFPRSRPRRVASWPLIALVCGLTALALGDPPPESQPAPPGSQPVPQSRPAPESQPSRRPDGRAGRRSRRADSQPSTAPASSPTSTQATSTSTSTSSTSTSTSQPAEKKDRYLAVMNGRVHTVTGPTVEHATVLAKNGKIVAVGSAVRIPPECEVVDADGDDVYPGLIAAGAGGIFGGANPEETTDVFGLNMNIAAAVGITTALSGNAALKLTFGSTENMLTENNVYLSIDYSSRNPLGRSQLRADLEKVRGYLRDLAAFEREKQTNKDAQPPDKSWLRDRYEQYRKLLAHEAIAVASAGRAQELRDLADLAEQFDFELVIRGAHEGWIVASDLARAHVGVIITPRQDIPPDDRSNRPTGSTIENARILREHGVAVAVVPAQATILTWGVAGRDLTHLNMEAAFAERGGLSNEDALRTITIDAARVLGLDDRIGSIEVGKDADLIVCDGDILYYMTQVHYTIVSGRVAYEKSKDSLYAHIRPEGKPDIPQFDDLWPVPFEWRE